MSPLNRSHVLREVLTRLGECPTPDGIAAAAKLFADRIADRRQPEMALAALFRHNAPESLGNLTRSTLRDETLAVLAERQTAQSRSAQEEPSDEGSQWLLVHEAAPRLRLQEKTLLERLKQWRHRQALGWPRWDGYRWLIPGWAVDAVRSGPILAKAPEREPLAHLLPEWCERQP